MRSAIGRGVALAAVVAITAGGALAWAQQEPGPVERVGEKIDEAGREAGRKLDEAGRKIRRGLEKGLDTARGAVRESFAQTRDRVHEMNVAARIYGRLHWDKMLVDSNLDLSVEARGIVTLRGVVPSDKARERAVQLAADTVGVSRVVDQLAVEPTPTTTPAPTPSEARPKVEIRTPAPPPVDPGDE